MVSYMGRLRGEEGGIEIGPVARVGCKRLLEEVSILLEAVGRVNISRMVSRILDPAVEMDEENISQV